MDCFEFTRLFCERPQSFAWLLGAGASRNANLPTAEDIITDLKRRYYCSEENQVYSVKDLQNETVRSTVESYLQSRGFPPSWAPEEYSKYFEIIFGENRERQRKYISAILSEDKIQLSIGNRVLGALMSSGLTRVAFTTNFDTVVEKAVAEIGGKSLSAFHLEGAQSANAAINNEEYPVYCKLHGDFRYEKLKNLKADLSTQNEDLCRSLVNSSNRFGFIIAGYSGRDESVMELLHEGLGSQNPFPHGIYWTVIEGTTPSKPILKFVEAARENGITAEILEIETYDTLMLSLWRNLNERPEGLDEKVRKGREKIVSIPIPDSDGVKPLIRYNAIPISQTPKTCLKFDLKINKDWKKISPFLRNVSHNLITTIDDEFMAWGNLKEAQLVFGSDFVSSSERSFEPDWRKTGRLNIKRFLEDGIGKAFTRTRPLLMRRRGPGVVLIVDKMAVDVGIFEPLHEVTGKTTGTIPDLSLEASDEHDAIEKVEFAESVRISFAWNNDQLWLLLKPDIWVWPPFARRHARQWLEQRRKDRRNNIYDSLLSAWISVLTDGAGRAEEVTITAYEGEEGAHNPAFTFSSRTGYSFKRRNG